MLVQTLFVILSELALAFGIDHVAQFPLFAQKMDKAELLSSGAEVKLNDNLDQYEYPGLNYILDKQLYPGVQNPILVYAGGSLPGQQFLLRPGSPPGNFLFPQPQPQPGVIFGAGAGTPVFTAGYPKPAHVPPIEKDAEEVPNLAGNHPITGRPILRPTVAFRKPEKLETLDEPVNPSATEADVLAAADKHPSPFPKKPTTFPRLKPGQRFFILNGQSLYSNFPLEQGEVGRQLDTPTFYQETTPETYFQYNVPVPKYNQAPVQDLFLRNPVTGEISSVKSFHTQEYPEGNQISLAAKGENLKEGVLLESIIPFPLVPQTARQNLIAPILVKSEDFKLPLRTAKQSVFLHPTTYFIPYASNLKTDSEEDDSVIIDAKIENDDKELEDTPSPSKSNQPSLSQAQPAAIALAGKGGVASAGPRGTALAGVKGLAIAKPQATAVAGPTEEEEDTENKKMTAEKKKQ